MYLILFALALVVLGAWLRSTRDDVLQTCGLWCYAFAVAFAVIAANVGCTDSPTAPTSTRIFGWTAAPGCSPTLPIPSRTSEPVLTLNLPGSLMQALWVSSDGSTLTVNFKPFGSGLFLVCDWTKTEKKS